MKINIQKNKYLVPLTAIIMLLITVFSGCTKADGTAGQGELKTNLTGREFMYIKSNGLYEHIPDKDEAIMISNDRYKKNPGYSMYDSSSIEAQYSFDGKYIYYLEAMDDYNPRALKAVKRKNETKDINKDEGRDTESETIASNVLDFKVLKNGKILYRTEIELGVYVWDGKDSKKIGDRIELYNLSEDESSMLYLNEVDYSSKGMPDFVDDLADFINIVEGTLYFYDFKNESYKISDNVIAGKFVYSKDFSNLYYVKDEKDTYNIYYIDDITKTYNEKKEPVFVAELGSGVIFMNKKTGGLYYLSENKESSLYDLIIEDDIPDKAKGVPIPKISIEDKKLMAEEKAVIKDKGLKEYALQRMKMEFKENIKKIINRECFGTLSYYDKNGSKELSTSTLVYGEISNTLNKTVSFTYFDKDKIEKIKLSSLFDDYIYELNENMDYSDESISDKEDAATDTELNLDKLIYEYYKDSGSPLGKYFYFYDADSGQFKLDLEGEHYSGAFAHWDYEETSGSIVRYFMTDILLKQSQAFDVVAALEDKVYKFEEGGHNIRDVYIDEEGNSIYIVKNDKETEDKIKSISDGSYKYFSSKINKAKDEIYNSAGFELYKADLKDGELGGFELLDSGAGKIYGIYNKKLYYVKDVKGAEGIYSDMDAVLYCDKKKIKSGFRALNIVNDTIYLETGANDHDLYNLYKLNGNDVERIGNDIYEYKILDDGSVAYIDNYNKDTWRGTLELWKDKNNKETVDKNVMNIVGGKKSGYYTVFGTEDNIYMKLR